VDIEGSYSGRQAVAAVAIVVVVFALLVMVFGGGQSSAILSNVGSAVGPNVAHAIGGSGQESVDSGGSVEDEGGVDDGGQIADAAARPPELLIIRTGTLEIVVPDLGAAVTGAAQRVTALGGYVSSSEETSSGDPAPTSGGSAGASVVYRIPADRWDAALAGVRGLATETRHAQVQTEAVTSQVVDLAARITNLRATEAALQAIMVKATTIRDVLDVQGKLGDVRGQIEQLVVEKAQLEGRAAFGTLTVAFSLPARPASEAVRQGWDPATDVDAATGALLGVGQATASLGIWLGIVGLPLLVVGVVVVAIGWRLRRLIAGRTTAEPGVS
jgi:hypothetical protein